MILIDFTCKVMCSTLASISGLRRAARPSQELKYTEKQMLSIGETWGSIPSIANKAKQKKHLISSHIKIELSIFS